MSRNQECLRLGESVTNKSFLILKMDILNGYFKLLKFFLYGA